MPLIINMVQFRDVKTWKNVSDRIDETWYVCVQSCMKERHVDSPPKGKV